MQFLTLFHGLKERETYPIPQNALLLGLGGLLPFIFGVLLGFFDIYESDSRFLSLFLLGYGAVILSFLGGVRWGDGLYARDDYRRTGEQTRLLTYSVLPALIAWLALLVPTSVGLFMLILSFIAQGYWDVHDALEEDIPIWYGRMRFFLSLGVISLLLIGFFQAL